MIKGFSFYKKYSVLIYKVKIKTIKGRDKYIVDDIIMFNGYMNIYLALHYCVNVYGCSVIKSIGGKLFNLSSPKVGQIIGKSEMQHFDRSFFVCSISPKIKRANIDSDLGIYPEKPVRIRFSDIDKRSLNTSCEKIIALEKEQKLLKEFGSLQTRYFFPFQAIPEGYEWIKEGIVQSGDFYYDSGSSVNENSAPHFISVDISFSAIKPGREIYYATDGKQRWPLYFVIRKIKQTS